MPNLVELLQLYGILIVFAIVLVEQGGLPIPAFPILVVSGALAASGGISWLACIAAAVFACLIADYFWFSAGRFYGAGVLRLLCRISLSPDSCVSQTEDRFARFGPKSLIVSKFIPGFNVIAAPMSGALGVRTGRFLAFSITGSILWAGTGIALGAYFHRTVDQVLEAMSTMGTAAVLVLGSMLALFILYQFVERRRAARVPPIEGVSIDDYVGMLEAGLDPLLIDARSTTAQSLDAPIPGALLYQPGEYHTLIASLDKDRHIVVYCNCVNDVTAIQLAKQFLAHGFHRTRPLQGGLDAWKTRNEGEAPAAPAGEVRGSPA